MSYSSHNRDTVAGGDGVGRGAVAGASACRSGPSSAGVGVGGASDCANGAGSGSCGDLRGVAGAQALSGAAGAAANAAPRYFFVWAASTGAGAAVRAAVAALAPRRTLFQGPSATAEKRTWESFTRGSPPVNVAHTMVSTADHDITAAGID